MRNAINKGFVLGISLVVWLGVAAQDDAREEERPTAEPAAESQEHGNASEDSGITETTDETQPPEETDPLADLDSEEAAEGQRETAASMERFRPTEKISEDRSVAFPNDI